MIVVRGKREIVVRMLDGENLVEGLLSIDVDGAVILGGIGMVREARLGYWNGSEYEEQTVADPAELLAMQGNIARRDGKRALHCHITVARRDGSVTGGHLIAGTVENTAEIVLGLPEGIRLERRIDANGLVRLFPEAD
jgi:predicted DNA-binding protein with PD1-like motif